MKKSCFNSKKIFGGLLLTVALTLFASCDGVIFDTIRDEVELADATISGDIQNIIRCTYNDMEHVFVSTGKISYRNISSDHDLSGKTIEEYSTDEEKAAFVPAASKKTGFSSFSSPSGFVYALAADSKNLYALTVVIEKDDDGYNVATSRTLWAFDASSADSEWKQIWTASYDEDYSAFLFCTNSPKPEHRHAYFRYGETVYELEGSSELGETGMATGDTDYSTTPTTSAKSCTLLGSTVYFSSAYAMTSNETLVDESTYIYYSSGDNVYYSSDGSAWTSVDLDCDTIYSLGITADYLLAGTDGGIVHTPLSDAIPSSGTADFSTNADSALSTYYEVYAIMVVDPADAETSATIFATANTSSTSASLNNVGLWSYFASEGEWNRE